jgi:general secretion pathway protein D
LREGEAAVLGGILEQQDLSSWTGIPGLSSIPVLKYLFGSKDHHITNDEVIFLLIPHVVRTADLTPVNFRAIDTGTGQSIELRRIAADNTPMSLSPVVPLVRPAAEPGVGVVPGQSAQAAAPAALAQLSASAQGGPPPAPNTQAPPTAMTPPGGLRFSLVPSSGSSVAAGATFQVPIVVTGARDIASVPLQVQYDAAKLALVNVGDGDFLGRDGQAVALVHRDDGPGTIAINASRPPGAVGVSGAGVVCVLTFQAKAAGSTSVSITRPGAMTSAQQPLQAEGAQTTIQVK